MFGLVEDLNNKFIDLKERIEPVKATLDEVLRFLKHF